jgi:hypothetical protein
LLSGSIPSGIQLRRVKLISEVKKFPLKLANPDRYIKVLTPLLHPMPRVRVLHFAGEEDDRGVAAIEIEKGGDGPYLVGQVVDESEKRVGAFFGYFERRQDVIPPLSLARIQQQFSAGRQWASIEQRLTGIEAMVKSSTVTRAQPAKDWEKERKQRLTAARIAAGRDAAPMLYLTATPEGDCDFPTLFASQHERIVRLIENPPELRNQGFAIWANRTSEIIDGRLRRNVVVGLRLIELWKDGLFVFIGPGDEDLLGWRMHGFDKPIHISNFVLTELVLIFCWLMRWIYEEANPKPPVLRLTLGVDNLQRPAGPPILSDVPEGKMKVLGSVKSKPGRFEIYELAELKDYDPERIAYLFLEGVYNWFGFNSESVPYKRDDENPSRIAAEKIIGRALPKEPPSTPGF